MANLLKPMSCAAAALLGTLTISSAQTTSPAPAVSPATALPTAPVAPGSAKSGADSLLVVQASAPATTAVAKPAQPGAPTAATTAATTTTDQDASTESGGVGVREFQGDDIGQVLRLLARQSKVNMVVSDAVTGTVTMRLEDVTALQAIAIIVKAKGLFMDKIENVYYIKTGAEKTAEPTESDSYQFSYARAKDIAPLMASQLASKDAPQVDERTNTVFFRETRSNLENIRKLLEQIDRPTKQVMIEARLVEVTANPRQSYGINWAGVVGSSTQPQTVTYGAPVISGSPIPGQNPPTQGFALGNSANHNYFGDLGKLALGQFAILSTPQLSATLRMLNEDADAEFLANPRVVTADNQQAKIEITRNQPVPQL